MGHFVLACLVVLSILSGLFLPACISDPPAPPPSHHVAPDIPQELVLTIEAAIAAAQRVPGMKTYALGVASPDSVYQNNRDTADAEMIVNGAVMRMTFERRLGQWQWIKTTSPVWFGRTKTPAEVLVWLTDHKP